MTDVRYGVETATTPTHAAAPADSASRGRHRTDVASAHSAAIVAQENAVASDRRASGASVSRSQG